MIDDWQRRGVGTLLLEVISGRARAEGIARFTALMLATNKEMMDLLQELDPVRIVDRKVGTVDSRPRLRLSACWALVSRGSSR